MHRRQLLQTTHCIALQALINMLCSVDLHDAELTCDLHLVANHSAHLPCPGRAPFFLLHRSNDVAHATNLRQASVMPRRECPVVSGQDVLVDFVVTLMRIAAEESSKRGKLSVEDLIFLVRKVAFCHRPRILMVGTTIRASGQTQRNKCGVARRRLLPVLP